MVFKVLFLELISTSLEGTISPLFFMQSFLFLTI